MMQQAGGQPQQANPQGAMPPAGMAGGMATPEQKQKLMDMIGVLEQKMGEFNAAKFAGANKSQSSKAEALRQVFIALQSAGVDINDPQSVNSFLNELKSKNPDLAQFFEECVSALIGDEAPEPQGMLEQDENPQDEGMNNEAIPQDI